MAKTPFEELTTYEEVTPEQILAELMSKKKKPFHTEIHNPFSISTLDILAEYYKDLGIKPLLKAFLSWYRTNMIAFNRKRAEELVRAYQYAKIREEERKLEEKLLGKR